MSSNAMRASPKNSASVGPFAREAREYKTAIRVHPRGALHGAIGVRGRHAGAIVAVRQRNAANVAVEMKAPRVIGAYEARSGVARNRAAQLDTAVRTAVVEYMDAPLPVAHHDHRLPSDLHGVIITRRLDLRFVSAIHPHRLEDLLDFPVKDLLIGVHRAVNAIRLNQFGDLPHCHLLLSAGPPIAIMGRGNKGRYPASASIGQFLRLFRPIARAELQPLTLCARASLPLATCVTLQRLPGIRAPLGSFHQHENAL